MSISQGNVAATIRHVTWIGFWINAALMLLKIGFGFWGHSGALVADGVHSLSDFATDAIVMIFVGLAYRHADNNHPYGHGKFETLATLLIGIALILVAYGIGRAGVCAIIDSFHGSILPRPELLTLPIALLSIVSKEWLYHFTKRAGKSINSTVLNANAWHHRSDAISSIATVIGVGGAIFLGEQWRILDPIVSVIIAVFIFWSAIKVCSPALSELLEQSLPADEVVRASEVVKSTPGVLSFHRLRSRRVGHSAIIDVHVRVNPSITVTEGHDIATEVEHRLRDAFSADLITNIHVEPQK
jgi:cation diffusion facilitator family transporter